MFTSLFLALNLVPVLTKTGDTSASVLQLDVEVNPVISLNLSKTELSLDVTPTINGAFAYDTTIATVSTNNRTGYTLTMNTSTDNIALTQENSNHKIKSLTSSATVSNTDQSNFAANSWGYAKSNGLNDDATFNAIPSVNFPATLTVTNEPVAMSSTPVTYATKLDTSIASGQYKNIMTFSAVTNHVTTATFSGILFMQEMTAAICSAETTPNKKATRSTDIHTNDSNFIPEAILTDARDGDTYIVRKLADGNCWMTEDLRITGNRTLTPQKSDVVSSFTLPAATTDGFLRNEIPVVAPLEEDYGTGAYYSWAAATASTGSTPLDTDGVESPSSICPKGWRLPPNSGNKSYDNLINQYGLTNGRSMSGYPLTLSYAGGYGDDTLSVAGGMGYYWSSTTKSSEYAYAMAFDWDNVASQDYMNRYLGFSVRCVARDAQYTINFDSGDADKSIDIASADMGSDLNLAYYTGHFSKTGATIKQWRDQDGRIYDANASSVNVNPDNKSHITLTAIWKQIPTTFAGITTMQEMTTEICQAETTPSREAIESTDSHTNNTNLVPEAVLIDTRDNNTYIVRKLADGNCWMVEDLRIVGRRNLSSADSDVSARFTLPAVTTASNSFSYDDRAQVAPINPDFGNGAYYSWTAATAGTGTSVSNVGEEAPSSICPKGWRLPSNTGPRSYYNLVTSARTTELHAVERPLSFSRAGYYVGGELNDSDERGYYWTSTAGEAYDEAYSLAVLSWDVDSHVSNIRLAGFSIRCVAR